ncbi:hypothetical protein [Cupriavidus taiwanensis]|uniref:Uncharacterized protein n=1 Tax=Cupriavidus taiwanensis (strain DSM 17343 / BCRC 17206 / CCUG 44338 / CIP 107171 / LMG 19424 / R1) TaxID=977880 RepID=B3R9S1_CUPTR|nr:hypothetical protein [Cupriavidus taiwanensis]CAQ71646.1 hypothetical protein RALTA_B1038 [Cupriavidus taiwanensis LMG 19424]
MQSLVFGSHSLGNSSIWPTCDYEQAKLIGYTPFNERFWRSPQPRDNCFTWDARKLLSERAPIGIQGFIVALPIMWTFNENNDSKMNLTILANVDMERDTAREQQTAATAPSRSDQVNV